jgi:predicted nucleotidyltransferase
LDKHYLPARDPSGFEAGTPRAHYTRRDAGPAIHDAEALVELCQRALAWSGRRAEGASHGRGCRGAARPEVLEVRLFGSLARGARNPCADGDLLMVVGRSDVAIRDRSPRYRLEHSPVPTDVLVCTRAELEGELAAGNGFRRRALAESLLYAPERRAGESAGAAP